MGNFTIKFWGVRGSIPAPPTNAEIKEKVKRFLDEVHNSGKTAKGGIEMAEKQRWIYGGNTPCVEIYFNQEICYNQYNKFKTVLETERFILDMGSGLRELGKALIPQMFKEKGISVTFLLSHVHWDHIQGLPFFAPLYINKGLGINNRWTFFGGTNWQKTAEDCIRGQMDAPTFPVSWEEIEKLNNQIKFNSVYDMMRFNSANGVTISCRKLNHPQETYGWRFEAAGNNGEKKVIAYTTDNEPWDPYFPDPNLLELAKDADVWITDCQYSDAMYHGLQGGLRRYGWGHSYPTAISFAAKMASVKKVFLFHYDPSLTGDNIANLEEETRDKLLAQGANAEVAAAYEGLEIEI